MVGKSKAELTGETEWYQVTEFFSLVKLLAPLLPMSFSIYKLPFIIINQPSTLNRTLWECLNPGSMESCSESYNDITAELLHTVKAVTAKPPLCYIFVVNNT